MKILLILMLFVMMVSCGKSNKSGGGATSVISTDPLRPSVVDGYLISNGTIEIGSSTYQMASSLTQNQINQKLYQSGIQPTVTNELARFRAHITGALINVCQQQTQYYNPQLCNGGQQSNVFLVSDLQFY